MNNNGDPKWYAEGVRHANEYLYDATSPLTWRDIGYCILVAGCVIGMICVYSLNEAAGFEREKLVAANLVTKLDEAIRVTIDNSTEKNMQRVNILYNSLLHYKNNVPSLDFIFRIVKLEMRG